MYNYAYMMNQTTAKPLKTTHIHCTFTYYNFKYFKFAIQNSQIAIQRMVLLRKFFSYIALLLCEILKRNRSLS